MQLRMFEEEGHDIRSTAAFLHIVIFSATSAGRSFSCAFDCSRNKVVIFLSLFSLFSISASKLRRSANFFLVF